MSGLAGAVGLLEGPSSDSERRVHTRLGVDLGPLLAGRSPPSGVPGCRVKEADFEFLVSPCAG